MTGGVCPGLSLETPDGAACQSNAVKAPTRACTGLNTRW